MISGQDRDPVAAWIEQQLAEPWPLAVEQLDLVCRVLAPPRDPAAAVSRGSPTAA